MAMGEDSWTSYKSVSITGNICNMYWNYKTSTSIGGFSFFQLILREPARTVELSAKPSRENGS